VIDLATQADLPEVAKLMAASEMLHRYAVTEASALQSLSAAFTAGDILLVTRDDTVTGFAWLTFAPRILNRAAYLRLLLVAPHARNKGLGSRLLRAVESNAIEHANHLYLLATTDNISARRFYERHGYRHVGDLPGLVAPDLDEALYHKRLRDYFDRVSAQP
jgi:GNAT superfamily N-acetyltransferase